MARHLGASQTFLCQSGRSGEENAKEVVALFKDQRQPDITIECSGAESSVATGIYATRSGNENYHSWPRGLPRFQTLILFRWVLCPSRARTVGQCNSSNSECCLQRGGHPRNLQIRQLLPYRYSHGRIRTCWRQASYHPQVHCEHQKVIFQKFFILKNSNFRFNLEKAVEAFETARTGSGGAIKVMIKCAKD